jgi:ATP-binding cassette subfamily C protein
MARQGNQLQLLAGMQRHRTAVIIVAVLSGVINLLALTGPFYMLQVYDRVLPSQSVQTLVGLTVIMLILFAAFGALDFLRIRIMARVGLQIDELLRKKVFEAVLLMPLRSRSEALGTQPVRDLDAIRGFLSGLGPTALFDLPWLPIFVLLLFLLHPWLGIFGLVSAVLLVVITWITENNTSKPATEALISGARRTAFAESSRRSAEVVQAMGMGGALQGKWRDLNDRHLSDQLLLADSLSGLGTFSKILRMVLQSAMLGLGAWLAVLGEVSAGTIIASTIVLGRALAPIELAIANWRGFVAARQGYGRLKALFRTMPEDAQLMPLPRPKRLFRVEQLAVAAPGMQTPLVHGVSFALQAGQAVGIVGPSGSGKSSLVRALVGAWLPMPRGGTVRLDGATLDQYSAEALGRDIGYLPQDVVLFDGTISENIARLDDQAPPEKVIAAARLAGCHDMIVQMADGYNTRIGEAGALLSGGQRQRVGLARALYGDPFLVVLDEPNSNLDANGDIALSAAIKSVRDRGGVVVIVAHRPSALNSVDLLLSVKAGKQEAFGPKEEILKQLRQAAQPALRPVEVNRNTALKLVAEPEIRAAPGGSDV